MRKKHEDNKWDADHYLADNMEPDDVDDYLNYNPFWEITLLSGKIYNLYIKILFP